MKLIRYKRITKAGEIINLDSETQLSIGIEDEHERRQQAIEKAQEEFYKNHQRITIEDSLQLPKKHLKENIDIIDDEAMIMKALRNGNADQYGF